MVACQLPVGSEGRLLVRRRPREDERQRGSAGGVDPNAVAGRGRDAGATRGKGLRAVDGSNAGGIGGAPDDEPVVSAVMRDEAAPRGLPSACVRRIANAEVLRIPDRSKIRSDGKA